MRISVQRKEWYTRVYLMVLRFTPACPICLAGLDAFDSPLKGVPSHRNRVEDCNVTEKPLSYAQRPRVRYIAGA